MRGVTSLLLPVAAIAGFVLGLRLRSARVLTAATALLVVALTALNQVDGDDYPLLDDLVFFTLLLGTPAVLGHLLRRRGLVIRELEARAEALREAHREEAAAAVAEERARLALGVHDALAHRVGEMSLQAAGARSVAGEDPARALEALAAIERAGRAALDDIREVIGVLRAGDDLALGVAQSPARPLPAPFAHEAPHHADPAPAADRGPGARDWLLAGAVFAALAIEAVTSAKREGPAAANVLACAAVAAPLAFRRRAPLASAAATFGAAALMALLLTSPELLVTPIVLLIVPPYAVAAHLPWRGALAGAAICVAGTAALGPGPATALIAALAFGAGRAVRDRQGRVAELADVSARLEAARGAAAARARGEERLRVARELHDAVAHSMTVIVLQAGAAQRVWSRDPSAALVAIDALADVARRTLSELRVTLRGTEPPDPPGRLDALEELAARVRPLGVETAIALAPDLEDVPPAVERVAFAVVQEALTNVVRHAAPTRVDVEVARDGDELRVAVTDRGPQPGGPAPAGVIGTGTGLRGMAERVEDAGGRLGYGAHGAGFRVEARLPVAEVALR